jgi:oligoendopeptidase F
MNNTLPRWNLSDLYLSISDQQIELDFLEISLQVKNLRNEGYQKIAYLSPEKLNELLKNYQNTVEKISKISCFAYLQYSCNLKNEQVISFYQNTQEKLANFSRDLVFIINEISQLSLEILQNLVQHPQLNMFKVLLNDIIFNKPYYLNEQLEKFNIDKNITGKNAFVRLFDETINNLQFDYQGKKLNSSQIFNLLQNSCRQTRKEASQSIAKVFDENHKIFTFITNILAKDKQVQDSWRGYKNPVSQRNIDEFLPDEVVDLMSSTIKKNLPQTSHRYYKLKAKILNLPNLEFYDRNAPLPYQTQQKISWQEAKHIVLDAFGGFSIQIQELANRFFTNNWIDADIYDGKESGAFSHPCVPSSHPYILMNYQENARDVATLAHELGHGVHQILAGKQGYFLSQTPLTLAETASIFAEELVFQNILQKTTAKNEKISLIANKIEDIINTAIRQIAFFEFEKKVHYGRINGELSSQQICNFWLEIQQESLGDAFNFSADYQYFWCYVPHFIHTPFYVYSYAFGYCLVNSLYNIYQKNTIDNFVKKYLTMLTAGGSKKHNELLSEFNLSMHQESFWQQGLNTLVNYIDILEDLLE